MAYSNRQTRSNKKSHDLDKHMRLQKPLSSDRQVVKIGDDSTGLLLKDKDVLVEGSSDIRSDLTVGGDLTVDGNIDISDGNAIVQGAQSTEIKSSTNLYFRSDASNPYWLFAKDGTSMLDHNLRAHIYTSSSNDTTQFMLYSPVNNVDHAQIKVGTNGVTTFETTDQVGIDADLTLDIDGDITLDSETGNFIAMKAGTEFSAENSSYAGMILGYTRIANDGTVSGQANISVNSGSMTVLTTTQGTVLSINFKAPPSGNVEIQCSFWMSAISDGAKFSLSTNASYAELDETHTYDADQTIYIDETDHDYHTISFSIRSLTAGNVYTYFLAGLASGLGVTISHGRNRTGGTHWPPIILKAIALPAVIVTGE